MKINFTSLINRTIFLILCSLGLILQASAQKKLPLIHASSRESTIYDGEFKVDWGLDPKIKLDRYYVRIPHRKNKVTLVTDQDKVSFNTKYGHDYDLVVVLNNKDSCFVRISATDAPETKALSSTKAYPDTIPFTLMGSRVYLQGILNGKEKVNIQFDTGAGISCVSKTSSDKLNLNFGSKTTLSNSAGINEVRKSSNNNLVIGNLTFTGIPLVESSNMQPGEDLIIGYPLFRGKIIEIDYDKHLFIVHEKLPANAKTFLKQPMVKGLSLKTQIVQNGKKYTFWVGIDTGRDGTMLIGQEFTGQPEVWDNLKELTILNGRKIIRLDATVAGVTFKDIVTNAADPTKPAARKTGTYFGNVILNHFNVIFDNINGYIYLKPNSRMNEPYSNYSSYEEEMKKLKQH